MFKLSHIAKRKSQKSPIGEQIDGGELINAVNLGFFRGGCVVVGVGTGISSLLRLV